ncbi:MAG: rhamnan synthesis F family protein [Acidithiobacillus sp.]
MLANSTASDLSSKPYVVSAAKNAITESLQRHGEEFTLDDACNGAYHLPRFSVKGIPLASIIIPTRNGLSDLRRCLNSLSLTEYPYTEILVIDNQSDDPDTLVYLSEIQRRPGHRVLSYPYPFDYAAMHNWAVPQARGEYICLLNNDTEVITPHWLSEMLGQAQRGEIGAVGSNLLYPDGTIQHGGVVLGLGGIASHAHKNHAHGSYGHFGRTALVQSFSAVTAACLVMRKSHWDQVGGMASELTVAFNDVDLCLRLREAGLRNTWLPHAILYHYESKSRGSDTHPDKLRRFALEHAYMQWRWGTVLRCDPAYNPNLTLEREDFSLAWPPRVQHPWRQESAIIDVPYGVPHVGTEPLVLAPGEEFQGSFPIPVGVRGMLTGISILIGNYGGASNGTLVLHLQDSDGHSAHAHSSLDGSQDNAMLPMILTQGEIPLQGQDRLFFHLRLEGATHPVAFWVYTLNERWGHQIPGHEDRVLRIELLVMERYTYYQSQLPLTHDLDASTPFDYQPKTADILPPDPSAVGFDRDFYVQLYPDIATAGVDPYAHYQNYGKAEGRLGQAPSLHDLDALHTLDPQRETVLVVCHDGSRSGAPILGYNLVLDLLRQYNVVTLFLGPGPMLEACRALGSVVLGPVAHHRHPLIADRTIAAILERTALRFAIINSVEARFPLAALARRHVATVSLIHEFAAYIRPHGAFLDTVRWSGATVFSSRLTRDDARDRHGELREIAFPVIPQGRCVLPGGSTVRSAAPTVILRRAAPPTDFLADGLVVLGLGTVELRKGVDLFLDCAARVYRAAPNLPIRFVWVGKGYDPENDTDYSVYLADQIQRAGLAQWVQFVDELPDLQGMYAAADLLLLSSRLDPMPNVAINALSEGLPVLCFDKATGIADILRDHGLAESCVAPYLDTARMAEQILAIAHSPTLLRELAESAMRLAAETFQMPHYVERIVALSERQRACIPQAAADIATINDAGILQPDYALQPGTAAADAEEPALLYVRSWACGMSRRKPFPGFHPGIYRKRHGLAQPDADPLADYLRRGRPEGPWLLQLITPDAPVRSIHGQRIALHIHAFYPDLVAPILEALGRNQTSMDLLVSVVNEGDRHRLTPLFQSYLGGQVEMRVVPNRGRDLGPLCTTFADTIRRNYDLVGHVHTKRSPHASEALIRQWVYFLLTTQLGGSVPMADRILGAMVADPRIGMVFPDDPNILSWGENRSHAEALAQRLGISALPLPEEIVFPVGSMFWARVSALEPLLTLGLVWEDYPAEPVPIDGTMLHALERLLPMIVTATGHTLALSQVPGVIR